MISYVNGKEGGGKWLGLDDYKEFHPESDQKTLSDAFSTLNQLREEGDKLSGTMHPYGFYRTEYKDERVRLAEEKTKIEGWLQQVRQELREEKARRIESR